MPDPEAFESESEFMSECVSTAVGEGRDQDQAVAMCLEMWRRKNMDDEGEVEKADTDRNAAKRVLTGLLKLLEDKTIPEKLRSELEGARDALRRTWSDLESEAGDVANQAASPAKAAQKVHKVVIGTEGVFPVENEDNLIAAYISAFRQSRSDAMQEIEAIAKEHGWQDAIAEARRRTKALVSHDAIPNKEQAKPNPPKKKPINTDKPSTIQTINMDGNKALSISMIMTKAERMNNGRIRWQARANTGEWDLEHERFDVTFWDDVLHNFSVVQEATTKGEAIDLPVPILDIAHYSFRLPPEKRSMARCGYPIKLWQDGKALMAQGYFDNTPLGVAAAIAAQKRSVEDRRVSIGVWPDWGRVELDEQGRRIYKGGRNRAYLDHLAMTSAPVDPGTELEVKSMTQKQDALDVLGPDAQALVDELETATTKAAPDAAIVKAECACQTEKAKPKPVDVEAEAAEGEAEPMPEPEKTLTMRQLKDIMADLFATFGKSLDERLQPIEASTAQIPAIKAQVEALGATETEKVKAAIDSGGDWLTQLVRKSVQRQKPVEGAEPQQAVDTSDPFYRVFGGLKPKQ